jgi:hypothetical protein
MSPTKDADTLQILVQIAGDIGETRGDIASLKGSVESITEDFRDVKEQLSQTVTKPECTQRHVIVAQSLDAMKKELIAEIKKPSGLYPTITASMLREAAAPTMREIEDTLKQKKEIAIDKKRKTVTFWLITLSTATALLGGCAVGLYKMAILLNRLEETVLNNTQQVKSELKNNNHRIIYVTSSPDAGISIVAGPPKKVIPRKK